MKPLRSRAWPATHLLNPAFEYRCAAATDLRATFARARERLARERQNEIERQIKVKPLVKPKERSA